MGTKTLALSVRGPEPGAAPVVTNWRMKLRAWGPGSITPRELYATMEHFAAIAAAAVVLGEEVWPEWPSMARFDQYLRAPQRTPRSAQRPSDTDG